MKQLCSIITLLVSFLLLTGKIQARITMPFSFRTVWCCNNKTWLPFGAVVIENNRG